jgi:outer membrane protein assembly factor BamB
VKPNLAFLTCLAGLAAASAADWPQWRGPERHSISSENVSTQWPAGGPTVLWRASVGTGFASVSVSQGRAYTLGNSTNVDILWCFDARTGKELWRHTYPAQLGPQYYEGGPGATPTVDGNRLFTISKWGDVFCLDAAKGSVVWQRDLRKDGIHPNRWGFAGSPLVWRELLILNAGAAGTALDLATGRVAWSNGTNAGGYASPTLFKTAGEETVLIFAAKHLVALQPQTGRELWRQFWETGWDTNNTDPLIDRDRILISSFSRGCALLSVVRGHPEVVYDSKVLRNHLSPGVLLGDYLYAFNGEARQETDLRCIHLPTGELKWTRKDPAFGSLICAGGKLVILSEKGELLVGDPSPAEFKPLARAKVLTGLCWTPPTLANGLLYVRNAKGELCCLDLGHAHAVEQEQTETTKP